MAERRHVRAQLVGAPRQRLKLDPGGAVAGAVDRAPAGLRRQPVLGVDVHLFAAGARLLGQRRIDQPFVGIRHADDQSPIDFARRTARKRLGEMPGRPCAPRHQQRTRRILVEPVDQLGPARFAREPVEQPIEVLRGLGPALRRQTRRFVEHERIRIFMDDHVADELHFLVRERLPLRLRPRRTRRRSVCRRNADLLPRLDPVAGRRPLARETQLPRPRPARDEVEADLGHVPLEPAVEPNSVVVIGNSEGARLGHARALSES